MSIYLPERHHAKAPELRAEVTIYPEPSQFGIHGGKVSKLTIVTSTTDVLVEVLTHGTHGTHRDILYNYDRGLYIDHLSSNKKAHELYQAVLEELN